MDIKEIAKKALAGEDYSTLITEFTPEQHIELSKELRSAGDEELKRVSALRQEGRRLETKTPTDDKKTVDVFAQFRTEQVEQAKTKLFSNTKFNLSQEEKALVEEKFKRLDSGKVDKELIYNDFLEAYAAVRSSKLISDSEKSFEFEKNAAQFNAAGAGGTSGMSSPDDAKYSQAAKDLFREFQKAGIMDKSIDDCQKIVSKGKDWKSSRLSK